MSIQDISSAVAALRRAEATRTPRGRLTREWEGLDLDTAYMVQNALVEERVAAGETVVGIKLGLTSRAKQERMGISSPLTAVLTDAYILPADVPVPLDRLIQPRAEPELVFVMGQPLRGPGVTAATALAAVDRVYGGFEIIDSRYVDYDFGLPDVVADNASSAFFVIGGVGRRADELDLALEAVVLSVGGDVVDTATGAAVQGHPAEALALAANALGARGQEIPVGAIVLTGGLTDAIALTPGASLAAEFTHLGTVHLSVER